MATKGSRLSRMVAWFKEADIEEADYVLGRALNIIHERKGESRKVRTVRQTLKKRTRKPMSFMPEVHSDNNEAPA